MDVGHKDKVIECPISTFVDHYLPRTARDCDVANLFDSCIKALEDTELLGHHLDKANSGSSQSDSSPSHDSYSPNSHLIWRDSLHQPSRANGIKSKIFRSLAAVYDVTCTFLDTCDNTTLSEMFGFSHEIDAVFYLTESTVPAEESGIGKLFIAYVAVVILYKKTNEPDDVRDGGEAVVARVRRSARLLNSKGSEESQETIVVDF